MGRGIIAAICLTATLGFCSTALAQGTPDNPQVNTILSGRTAGGPSANPARPIQSLPPEQRAALEVQGLDSTVQLTEEQKIQLRQVFSTIDNEQELTKSYNEYDPAKTNQADQQLMQQKQQAISRILTQEQQARLRYGSWGSGLP